LDMRSLAKTHRISRRRCRRHQKKVDLLQRSVPTSPAARCNGLQRKARPGTLSQRHTPRGLAPLLWLCRQGAAWVGGQASTSWVSLPDFNLAEIPHRDRGDGKIKDLTLPLNIFPNRPITVRGRPGNSGPARRLHCRRRSGWGPPHAPEKLPFWLGAGSS